ncbi:hypothetical protein FB45DRAFT_170030 [Roridomyces roridus]|uniref:Uncharacterized protein n=1 Tax=Roridomyces roridus TaxID=1738132 RepID=A0AAD7BEN9_9AGAR|nr:hypothetical protein FB45DRAFT_170030 [Roridomyces roridus]
MIDQKFSISPSNVTTFCITILREAQGVRLIGSAEIAQGLDEGLDFGEDQKPWQLPLTTVNLDGPLLTLAVAFNSTAMVELSSKNDMPIQIAPSDSHTVPVFLMQKLVKLRTSANFQDLWMMHMMILFLLSTTQNQERGRLLNLLSYLCLQQWYTKQSTEALDQAVLAYDDAIREGVSDIASPEILRITLPQPRQDFDNVVNIDRVRITWIVNLRDSVAKQFRQLGRPADLQKWVSLCENVLDLTPEGDPYKANRLSNLGVALMTQYEQFGHLDSLDRLVSVLEDAVHCTPKGHPDKAPRLTYLRKLPYQTI